MAKYKTINGVKYRFLSHAEKEAKDQELTDQGLSGFIIERDGKKYEFINGKMVPLSAKKARKAIGRGKKAKKA